MIVSKVKIPVIYFHSIQPLKDETWIKNFLTLEMRAFEFFLHYLKEAGWQTLFLSEMYEIKKNGRMPPGKYCCLSFDDGYMDNYVFAYPLLQKYGHKGTVFVSPECVDTTRNKAATLFDVWRGEVKLSALPKSRYLSWDEIREMQSSGVMDIQSHTMSHTKYFASDTLRAIHLPGHRCFHPIINKYPQYKTTYFGDLSFERLIPYGSPLLEEKSAVITKIHEIDEDFEKAVLAVTQPLVESPAMDLEKMLALAKPIYQEFRAKGKVAHCVESDAQYEERLYYEIVTSKKILEQKLGKEVDFLCWPHGDNNERNHLMALEAGYRASTVGKSGANPQALDRFERTGIKMYDSNMLSKLGFRYKLRSHAGKPPESWLRSLRASLL